MPCPAPGPYRPVCGTLTAHQNDRGHRAKRSHRSRSARRSPTRFSPAVSFAFHGEGQEQKDPPSEASDGGSLLQTAGKIKRHLKPLRRNGFKTDQFSLKAIDFIKLTKKGRRLFAPGPTECLYLRTLVSTALLSLIKNICFSYAVFLQSLQALPAARLAHASPEHNSANQDPTCRSLRQPHLSVISASSLRFLLSHILQRHTNLTACKDIVPCPKVPVEPLD